MKYPTQNSKDWVRMNESIKLSGKPAIVEGTMCLDQFLGISPRLFNGNFKCFWVEVEKAVAEERRLGIFQRCWNSQREFVCIKLLMLIRLHLFCFEKVHETDLITSQKKTETISMM